MDYFWTNSIWYLLLGIITIIQIIFFILKAENRGLVFAIFLAMSGIAFTFEVTIYTYFKSYMYYPMIFRGFGNADAQITVIMTRFYDGLFGNYFSQFSVAATAVLIACLRLKKICHFIFAGIYCVIEELFKYMGIYKQYWYRTWMTFIGLIILFWITEGLYKKSLQSIGLVLRYIVVSYGSFALLVVLNIPLILSGVHHNLNLVSDPVISDSIPFVVDNLLVINAIMTAYYLKFKWQWLALVMLVLEVCYYVSWKFELIFINCNTLCFSVITIGSILGTLWFVNILNRLLPKKKTAG